MRTAAQSSLALFAAILLAAAVSLAQRDAVIAITGATVVDGTGAAPRAMTVVIRGDRVAAAGPDARIPPGARVIRAEGHTLAPGFFDLHTHLPYSAVAGLSGDWGKALKAYLYCGVTSVVDFGVYPEMFEPMRRLLREGVVAGPRISLAARLTTPGGHGAEGGRGDGFSLEVSTPQQARAAMARLLASKPDVIKVFTDGWRYGAAPDMTSMNEETLAAIVAGAHQGGIPVLTHTVTLEKARIAARAGVDVLAHSVGDARVDDALIALMKKSGAAYAPTLTVYEPRSGDARPPLLEAVLEPAARNLLAASRRTEPSQFRLRRWQFITANVAALRAAGIAVASGTDAGVTGAYHGWATLREIELLSGAGLSPLEALTAATGVAARALRVDAERGTIAPGMLADLVLIEGQPHQRIADLQRIRRVFLGGREIDRAALARDIAAGEPTPLPARPVATLVDDMEADGGRSTLGTLRVWSGDSGTDASRMMFARTASNRADHALSILARMAAKPHPYAALEIPKARRA